MVSLDDTTKIVKAIPNKYIYNITGKLTPTNYQSVLATVFVFFSCMIFEIISFINRYKLKMKLLENNQWNTFRVYTTAVYTVFLYTMSDGKVC